MVSRYLAETERKHEAILDHALRKDDLAALPITAADRPGLYHGCDWEVRDGCLIIEGESRSEQDERLWLLILKFLRPNGYTLAGEMT